MSGRRFFLPGGEPVALVSPLLLEQHIFRVTVKRVVDGDTFIGDLRTGYRNLVGEDERLRLAGCNAWEKATVAGQSALANLAKLLPAGTELTVRLASERPDQYGRLLVTVTLDDGTELVDALIAQQWAAPWDGRGVAPKPPWPRTVQ